MISEELDCARLQFWRKHLHRMPPPLTSGARAIDRSINTDKDTDKIYIDKYFINYMVEADPDDTLTFRAYDGDDEEIIQMHTSAWLQSMDYLLCRRLTLALREDCDRTIKLPVPSLVQERYHDYKKDPVKDRKNLTIPIPSYFPKPSSFEKMPKADGYVSYQAPPFLEPSRLNLFCHEIFTRPNNKNWLQDPRRDAIPFQLDGMGSLPVFQLEDYVAHELKTGISLSTEITAVVLELNDAIRDIALNVFFETALEDIVRFPFPFARISAARNFFQQIDSEWSREKYLWNPQGTQGRESEILADAFRRARKHVNSLHTAPIYVPDSGTFQMAIAPEELEPILRIEKEQMEDPTLSRRYRVIRDPQSGEVECVHQFLVSFLPIFPITKDPAQMDIYMEHIDAYLQCIRSPLDWSSLKDKTPEHLAVFTNPSHRHIPLLLHYIKTGTMFKLFEGDALPCVGKDAKNLFSAIHKKVRATSSIAYAEMNWIKKHLYTY